MNDMYFWVNGEVLARNWGDKLIREVPCVDLTQFRLEKRYGYFKTTNTGGWNSGGWEPTPFNEFPPLFHMHLLLLGVA